MAETLKQIKDFTTLPDFGDNDLLLAQSAGITYNVKGTALKAYAVAAARLQAEAAAQAKTAALAAQAAAEAAKTEAAAAQSGADSAKSGAVSAQEIAETAQAAALAAKTAAETAQAAAERAAEEAQSVILGQIPDGSIAAVKLAAAVQEILSRADVGGALDESIAKVQQSVFDHMVGANLLNNWYFVNPVNQRGQTEYSGAGYGMDCWKMYQSQVSLVVQPNGIAIRRSSGDFFAILQYIEDHVKISGKTVTFSMLIKAAPATYRLRIMTGSTVIAQTDMQSAGTVGVISLTAAIPEDLTDLWVTIYISPSTDYFLLEGAKLEIGTRQTLAHQDESGNWVINEIPDYGEQLRRCQRYFVRFTATILEPGLLTSAGTAYYFGVNLPTTMRTTPVIVGTPSFRVRLPGGGYSAYTGTEMKEANAETVIRKFHGSKCLIVFIVDKAYDTNNISFSGEIDGLTLSAEL